MKAGIMEFGDIFVINKCDRAGSDKIEFELKILQQISYTGTAERPIVKIVAPQNIGITELYQTVLDHEKMQQENNVLNSGHRARIKNEIIYNVQQSILPYIKKNVVSDQEIEDMIDDVFDNKSDPLTISLPLIEKFQENTG